MCLVTRAASESIVSFSLLSALASTRIDRNSYGLRRRAERRGPDHFNRQPAVHGSAQDPVTEGFPFVALSASGAAALGAQCPSYKCTRGSGRSNQIH